MQHRNRLNVRGRKLIVQRVRVEGQNVAHVAAMMDISRTCAHRWLKRWDSEGADGLEDRSSKPHQSPARTPHTVEQTVLSARKALRIGPDQLSDVLGVPARTISRILRRHNVAYLRDCDPLTGELIRSSKATAKRYERDRPGELIHMDVKKLGRIHDGGGWKAHGRHMGTTYEKNKKRIGFDFVHSVVDDYSRLAYSEVLPNEKGDTCGAFLLRAADFFDSQGIHTIEEVMTDNHWSYTRATAMKQALEQLGAKHRLIKPHCPWQNGKVERFNRTLQSEWAYKQVFTSNSERAAALQPWLEYYNNHRNHTALGRKPPITRVQPT